MAKLDVFFTVDVEIWCGSWSNLDQRFPGAFRQYVYGPTPKGEVGLRYQAKRLQERGLRGVFFVEPLFALRFGIEPLAEIVGILREHDQEVQLHMHPEWIDETPERLLPHIQKKRSLMREFSYQDQCVLIAKGIELIMQAGGKRPSAFRAGSFGFNTDTLKALETNQIYFDSSYNASMGGVASGLRPGETLVEPLVVGPIIEYPMTVFDDGTPTLRHAQVGAISFGEMESMLWQASEQARRAFVILFHNFELLNQTRTNTDFTVLKRFNRLCDLLADNPDHFNVCGFEGLQAQPVTVQPEPLSSNIWNTGTRIVEQVLRRRY